MGLTVSLDGGLTYVAADEVRINYDFPDNQEQLSIVATHEGIITDVTNDGEVVGTSSEMACDIIDRLQDAS